ncbi:MAG: dihydrofolate reductase [Chloroflexi bacterium]|jgi:dihydrofolate reductase|nr:dihydrofolate reductase [Chloroflexota bacterium]
MKETKINVSVYIATSLDGFIARPDGDVSWLHEVEPIEGGDDAGFGEFFGSVDVLVMGRGTFEKVLEFDWPYGAMPVIVLSRSLTEVPKKLRDRVRIEAPTPQVLLEKLSQEGFKRLYLDGGKVIQSFLREGLVDDMTLTTIPVLIGEGLPLFGRIDKDIKLRLLECRSWNNGFVQSKYQVLN